MTDQQHSITPPPDLVQQIADGWGTWLEKIRKAYCAGADQELEASVAWLIGNQNPRWGAALQEARRPKPKSQAEEALGRCNDYIDPDGTIRAALERLRELEGSQ